MLESCRFEDEDDYESEIYSIISIARTCASVILAGKHDSRRHSTAGFSENVVVAGTSYQMCEVFIILRSREGLTSFSMNNRANVFSENKSKMKLSVVSFFCFVLRKRAKTLS